METPVTLAREAISTFLLKNEVLNSAGDLPNFLSKKTGGVFITLLKSDNGLRSIMGNIKPTKKNLVEEIIHTSIAAAFYSPYFKSVQAGELEVLKIIVDIIENLRPISKDSKIDIKKNGLMIETIEGKQGIVLPETTIAKDKIELMEIAARRGKINLQLDRYKFFKFTTKKFK